MEHIHKKNLNGFPPETLAVTLDGTKTATLRTFYPKIAGLFHFPDYFGKNLDALFDCLTSLDNIPNPNVVLIILDLNHFLEKETPEKRAAALKILNDAELPENRYDGKTFRVIGVVD
jgi:RNAse (barnase) inhibitor barstar